MTFNKPFVACMLVPTGIGAAIGGYAGDATPAMNLLASCSDILITHPNVANAAIFQKLPENALYVEGYALDQFFKGQWRLQPVRANRLGVLMDCGVPHEMKVFHHNVIRAQQAVYGIDVVAIEETETPLGIIYGLLSGEAPQTLQFSESCSGGSLKNPDTLLSCARKLKSKGAQAIAICAYFDEAAVDDKAEADYKNARGVDPVGGLEAILSHTVVAELELPAANSPVFPLHSAMPEFGALLNPKIAAEYLSPTFLPCVLQGLSKAPRILSPDQIRQNTLPPFAEQSVLSVDSLDALIVPADALGSVPVLSCLGRNIPVIAVAQNRTVCNLGASDFPTDIAAGIYHVHSYLEAAGLIQALKAGLCPKSLGLGEIFLSSPQEVRSC